MPAVVGDIHRLFPELTLHTFDSKPIVTMKFAAAATIAFAASASAFAPAPAASVSAPILLIVL